MQAFGGLIGAQVLSIISDLFGYERRGVLPWVLSCLLCRSVHYWRTLRIVFSQSDQLACAIYFGGCIGHRVGTDVDPVHSSMTDHVVVDNKNPKFKALEEIIQNPRQL